MVLKIPHNMVPGNDSVQKVDSVFFQGWKKQLVHSRMGRDGLGISGASKQETY